MPIKIVTSPTYSVFGSPLTVPFLPGTDRTIDATNSKKLLSAHTAAKRVGCYIFTLKNGKKLTPWYVGKATKSFSQEVFNQPNCLKYAEAFGLKKTGTGLIFFIAAPKAKGVPNKKWITKLETFLIGQCSLINPQIRNAKNITVNKFVITGVMNGGAGPRSSNAKMVHSMLGRD